MGESIEREIETDKEEGGKRLVRVTHTHIVCTMTLISFCFCSPSSSFFLPLLASPISHATRYLSLLVAFLL